MRIFVAGASGAIGLPLIAELVRRGHTVRKQHMESPRDHILGCASIDRGREKQETKK